MAALRLKITWLILLGIACFFTYLALHQDAYNLWSDSSIYADIARNFVNGKGFTSNTIMPGLISYAPKTEYQNWPAFYPLLHPILIGIFFILFGISSFSVILTSGFFYIATIPFLFLLAKRIYSEKIAVYSCLFYILSPIILDYSISGMSEPLFTFLIVVITFSVFKKNFLLAGILVSLASLTKFQGNLLIPSILILIFQNQNKFKNISYFFVGFLSIFLARKILLPKNAFDYTSFANNQLWSYIARDAFISPDKLFRQVSPVEFSDILHNYKLIFFKLISNTYLFFQKFFSGFQVSISILALMALLDKNQKDLQFKIFVASLLVTFSLFHILTYLDFRYLHPLIPLLMILASNFWVRFTEKMSFNLKYKLLFTIFFIIPLLTFPGLATNIRNSLFNNKKPTQYQLISEFVDKNTGKDSVLVSDLAPSLVWQAQKKAIFLPESLNEMNNIDENYQKIDGILLYSHEFKPHYEKDWQDLIDNPRKIPGFYSAKVLEIKAEDNYYSILLKVVLYLRS